MGMPETNKFEETTTKRQDPVKLNFKIKNPIQRESLIRHLSKIFTLKEILSSFSEKTGDELSLTIGGFDTKNKRNRDYFINWVANMPQLKTVINEFPTEIQLDLIEKDPELYKGVNNPSEEFTLKAIKRNFWVIDYIDYPSDELQVAALMQSKEAVCAVVHNGYKDYKLGPKASQLVEIWSYWGDINNIENPCEEAIELAARIKKEKKETIQRKNAEEQQTMEEYERTREQTIEAYERLRDQAIANYLRVKNKAFQEVQRLNAIIKDLKNNKKESE